MRWRGLALAYRAYISAHRHPIPITPVSIVTNTVIEHELGCQTKFAGMDVPIATGIKSNSIAINVSLSVGWKFMKRDKGSGLRPRGEGALHAPSKISVHS